MARIQEYEHRVESPAILPKMVKYTASDVSPWGSFFQELGSIGQRYAAGEAQRASAAERTAELVDTRDAHARAVETAATTELNLYQKAEESKRENNLDLAAYPGRVLDQFDQATAGLLDQEKHPRARLMLRESFAAMRTRFGERAIRWAAEQQVAERRGRIGSAVDAAETMIATDVDSFDAITAPIVAGIRSAPFLPAERDTLAAGAQAKLDAAGRVAFVQRYPQRAAEVVKVWTGQAMADMPADVRAQHDALPEEARDSFSAAWLASVAGREQPARFVRAAGERRTTGLGFVDRASPQELAVMLNAATTIASREQAQARARIAAIEHDAEAAMARGEVDPRAGALTVNDYAAAFGADGAARFRQLQAGQATAVAISQLSRMPDDQIIAAVAAAAPQAGEGAAEGWKRHDVLSRAAEHVRTLRQKDPIAASVRAGVGVLGQINLGDPKAAADELANRTVIARRMQALGAPLVGALGNVEADALRDQYEAAPPASRVAILKGLRDGIPDRDVFLATVARVRPDSPTTMMAAALAQRADTTRPGVSVDVGMFSTGTFVPASLVAERLVTGEDLLNPSKGAKREDGRGAAFKVPDAAILTHLRNTYAEALGAANGGAFAAAVQGVRAYYAATAAEAGIVDGKPDDGLVRNAASAVLGDTIERAGRRVLAPWGMDAATFKAAAEQAIDRMLGEAGLEQLRPIAAKLGLERIGADRYGITAGGKPVVSREGRPLIVDFAASRSRAGEVPR